MAKQYKTGIEIYKIGTQYYNDAGHCSVVAVAVSTGVAYGRALKEMTRQGRVLRQGASQQQIHDAIKSLGYTVTRCDMRVNGTVSTITSKLPNLGTFIAYVRGHILTIRDGKVMDWSEGRRHRILSVYQVQKAGNYD